MVTEEEDGGGGGRKRLEGAINLEKGVGYGESGGGYGRLEVRYYGN